MNTSLDQNISRLYQKGLSPAQIASTLRSSIDLNNQKIELAYCGFLFSAGLYSRLFSLIIEKFQKKQSVPWFYFFLIGKKTGLNTDYILNMLKKSQNIYWRPLFFSSMADDPEGLKIQQKKILQFYKKASDKYLYLYMKHSRFRQFSPVEGKILKTLIKKDPKNSLFQLQYSKHLTRQASHILDQYKKTHFFKPLNRLSEPETDLIKNIQNTVKQHPHTLNDMAVFLFTSGCSKSALSLLENHLDHPARKRLYVDFLLESRQYLKCLNTIDHFLLEPHCPPDIAFEWAYLKAFAYYGLKEYKKAENLAQHLSRKRPRHQAVQKLLFQCRQKG